MQEIPSVELARLDDKDVSSERFRHLLDRALHEGRIVDLARSISCSAAQIRLGQISIVLIAGRPVRHQQKMKLFLPLHLHLPPERSCFEVQKPSCIPLKRYTTLTHSPVIDEAWLGFLRRIFFPRARRETARTFRRSNLIIIKPKFSRDLRERNGSTIGN